MNLNIYEVPIKDWSRSETGEIISPDGFTLTESQQEDLCRFSRIPTVLPGLDSRLNTNTVLPVLKQVSEGKEKFLLDTENNKIVSVINPRSRFVTDEAFNILKDKLSVNPKLSQYGLELSEEGNGITRKLILRSPESTGLDELYKKQVVIERNPQGGEGIYAQMLRLACVNGMMVTEKQMAHFKNNGILKDYLIEASIDSLMNLNVDDFLKARFMRDGKFIPASVQNFQDMKALVNKYGDKDIANYFFPEENIVKFYDSKGINISKLNRGEKQDLPSGLSYYDCFNFLTNAEKQFKNRNLEAQVAIGRFSDAAAFRSLRRRIPAVEGQPLFEPAMVQHLKGDRGW